MSGIRDRVLSTLAGQLGRPHGLFGKGVAHFLNLGNKAMIESSVRAADPAHGARVADIGFGGGVGLTLLLDAVGADGVVHGVEVATDMLTRARAAHTAPITAGRLTLTEGSMTSLPLETDSLDAAITVNTIYFVPDLDTAATELARVIRPGGTAVIGIGDPDTMSRIPLTRYGFTLRPVPDVIAALERAGCKVEHRPVAHKPIPYHLLIARPN
ncbi:class I SAM-dependent methyltransferase [Nocardia bovistercoris]|uniref:Methyltransferase domain-containing protein n=1 Tax=Nocardia bovistercoris TaxID=2785916 RepID=A0A931N525_9NOCA|nr:methyltransferase domain-containing protein [Nocardia bovistercoris]MBH0778911.1 methyltransferase domain-containing protein [Nocardia bovistercoris]